MDSTKIEEKKEAKIEDTDFFDETYSKLYGSLLDLELEDQLKYLETNFLVEHNNPNVLDLCCGNGRHLIPLSKKGYQLYGVDINSEYISEIKNMYPKAVNVYCDDAQTFSIDNKKFDLIYSIESSIGYLSDDGTLSILKNVENNLKSEGKFVLHLINKEYLIKNLTPRMWFSTPGVGYVLESRSLDLHKGIITLDQLRIIDDKKSNYSVDLRLYSFSEIKNLLNQANLIVESLCGGFNGETYDLNAPYMIVVATK